MTDFLIRLAPKPAALIVQAQQPWVVGSCVSGDDVATIQGLECLIANVLMAFFPFLGLTAFVMLLVGGYRYLTSGGNSKGTETARNTITFAIIGIVVAISSYFILNLISDFTGLDNLLNFQVPETKSEIKPSQQL